MADFEINSNGVAVINWTEAEKRAKGMTVEGLRFAIDDCREAIKAMPEGHKAGYYQDFIHVCVSEKTKRIGN